MTRPRLELVLRDQNRSVVYALARRFSGAAGVRVEEGDLFGSDLRADAVLSPANSFGDMGGGVDQAIDRHFGGEAQRAAQYVIRERWFGELPVGAAEVIDFQAGEPRYLVVAPTMRVPGSVSQSLNAYLAFRAALVAILRYNLSGDGQIRSLASTGLGSGVGGMSPGIVAEQMATAYAQVLGGEWRRVLHPARAPFASQS